MQLANALSSRLVTDRNDVLGGLASDMDTVKRRLDPRVQITENPWRALGVALALGALYGLKSSSAKRGGVSGLALSLASGLALRFVREAAMKHVVDIAKDQFFRRAPQTR